MNKISYVAVCKYKDCESFYFYSPEFICEDNTYPEVVAKELVRKEFKKISPHQPPEIVDFFIGYILFVEDKKLTLDTYRSKV